ncbi:5497_t:CDS:1, partial [Racocetra fulgida]
ECQEEVQKVRDSAVMNQIILIDDTQASSGEQSLSYEQSSYEQSES